MSISTLISASTVDVNSSWQSVSKARAITFIVIYTRSGSSVGDLSFQGSYDGTNTYPLEVTLGNATSITSKNYTTSLSEHYTVLGVHNQVRVSWDETTDGATISVYMVTQDNR